MLKTGIEAEKKLIQTSLKYRLFIILLMTLLSMFINYFPLPFVAGSGLIFGNVIAVAVTLLFGFRAGLFCALASAAVTYFIWHSLLIFIPYSLEILAVSLAVKKGKNPLFFGVVYWLTLGWMIVAIEFYVFTELLPITKTAIVLKYIFNGILNVILGYILAQFFKMYRTTNWNDTFKIHRFISYTVAIILILSVFSNSFFWIKNTRVDKLSQLETSLTLQAKMKAKELATYLETHINALRLLSKVHYNNNNVETWKATLPKIKSIHPNILTMLVTDHSGEIFATAPDDLMAKIKEGGNGFTNVSTRGYFFESKKTMLPYVSEVFQGRGFGNDPIVAVSVPLSDDNGFIGIVEASLDLTKIKGLDVKLLTEEQGLLIFDENKKVIYSSDNLPYKFLESVENNPINDYINQPENYYFIDHSGQYHIGMAEKTPGFNWTVYISVPRTFYENQMVENVIFSMKLLALFLIVSLFVTSKFAKLLSRPIEKLNQRLLHINKTGDFEKLQLDVKPSMFTELNSMSTIIQEFSFRLNDTLFSLKKARINKEKANKALAVVNSNLENIIESKTKALQEALLLANEANNAKSDFLSIMSHEIRTPLNGVLGMLELLADSNVSYEQREKINIAKTSATILLSLLSDILDFSKIEAGKLDIEVIEFNLVELLSDVLLSHGLSAENKGINLLLDTNKITQHLLVGDPTRVRQVLTNLISNAIKFTEKGCVTVNCETVIKNEQVILSIAVSDTGIGIPSQKLKNLFTPFIQADASTTRKFGGSGLGLAISKQLCALMNGDITATSESENGSTFTATMTSKKITNNVSFPSFQNNFKEALLFMDVELSLIIEKLLCKLNVQSNRLVPECFINAPLPLFNDNDITDSKVLPTVIIIEKALCSAAIIDHVYRWQQQGHYILWLMPISSLQENSPDDLSIFSCKPVTPNNLITALTQFTDKGKALVIDDAGKLKDNIYALIVEDNRINQQVALKMLSAINVKADIANHGVEALSILRENPHKYDVVFMDCQMPEMDGFVTTENIRSGNAGLPIKDIYIIALTANVIKGDRERCIASGMNDYLSKPIVKDKLKSALMNVAISDDKV